MKNLILLLSLLGLTIIYISCGGGGDFSTPHTTNVTINLGEVQSASKEKGGILKETTAIPSEVVSIRFTISAPDMVTIQRIVDVSGRTIITETFEIPNGQNRLIVVEALDARGNVIYRGETTINLTGTSVTLRIILQSTSPPIYVDLSISNSLIYNDGMALSFQVNNTGNTAANDILVYVLYADYGGYANCQSLTVRVIPAGGSVNQSLQVSYPVYAINYYKIIIDPENTILEADEANNVVCEWDEYHCSAPPPTNCL